ncbi:MAG: DUF1127 domain-containing protein [Sulfitobacter sp.]
MELTTKLPANQWRHSRRHWLAIGRWFERQRARRQERRTAIELARLPSHLLRDIGYESRALGPKDPFFDPRF